jgi:glutaminyl-peptide cyclotransferase
MSIRYSRPFPILMLLVSIAVFACTNCGSDTPKNEKPRVSTPAPKVVQVPVPTLDADSTYLYIKKQVDFGPRVPGTPAHQKCAVWLVSEFKRHGMNVIEQKFEAKAYFGNLPAVNIIAQYKPELTNRVLICAHWDSRHVADSEDETKNKNTPILGADDGGSGIAMLLEIARNLKLAPIDMGVDLICFDAEDLGDDRDVPTGDSPLMQAQKDNSETWCLGSQYWSKNLHKLGYTAQFGILLDMVGAKGARFPKEGYSTSNAMTMQDKIYSLASAMNMADLFPNENGGAITDDHVFVMRGTRIPVVDLISMPNPSPHVFGKYHHTHDDNMSIIDKSVLKSVGQLVTAVVWRTHNGTI